MTLVIVVERLNIYNAHLLPSTAIWLPQEHLIPFSFSCILPFLYPLTCNDSLYAGQVLAKGITTAKIS